MSPGGGGHGRHAAGNDGRTRPTIACFHGPALWWWVDGSDAEISDRADAAAPIHARAALARVSRIKHTLRRPPRRCCSLSLSLVLLTSASVASEHTLCRPRHLAQQPINHLVRRLDRRFDADFRYKGKVRNDLRYRTQILVVGDGVRSRICEAMLDRLCEGVDADVDAMAATLGSDRRPVPELIDAGESLGLSRLPLEARARDLQPTDLLTSARWDVIVCTDLETLESVRSSRSLRQCARPRRLSSARFTNNVAH